MTRYDRYGDPVDDEDLDEQPPLHDPRCRNGWLGEDDQDRPIPCLACRPHLRDHPPACCPDCTPTKESL